MRYNTLRHQLKWNPSNQNNNLTSKNTDKINPNNSHQIQHQKHDLLQYMWLQKMVNDIHEYKQNVNRIQNKLTKQQQKDTRVVLKQRCLNLQGSSNDLSNRRQKSQLKRTNVHMNKMIKFQIIVNKQRSKQKDKIRNQVFSLTQKKNNTYQQSKQKQKVKLKIHQNMKQSKNKSLPKRINPCITSTGIKQQNKQKQKIKNKLKIDEILSQKYIYTDNDNVSLLWGNKPQNQNKQKISDHKNNQFSDYYQTQNENNSMERKKSIGKIIKNNDRLLYSLSCQKQKNKMNIFQKLNSSQLKLQNLILNKKQIKNKDKQQQKQQFKNKIKNIQKIVLNLQTQKLTEYLGQSQLFKEIKQKKLLCINKKNNQNHVQNIVINQLSIIDRVDTIQLNNFTIESKRSTIQQVTKRKKQQRKLNRSVNKQKHQKDVMHEQGILLHEQGVKLHEQGTELPIQNSKSSKKIDKQSNDIIPQIKPQSQPKRRQQQLPSYYFSCKKTQQKLKISHQPQKIQLQISLQKEKDVNILQKRPQNEKCSQLLSQTLNLTQNIIQAYYTEQITFIFDFLDQKNQGKLHNRNCYYRQLPYDLKILLNTIIDDIFTKRAVYTLVQFIKQAKRHLFNDHNSFIQQKKNIDDVFKQSLEILKYKTQLMHQTDKTYMQLINLDRQQIKNDKSKDETKASDYIENNHQEGNNYQLRKYSMIIDEQQKKNPLQVCQASKKQPKRNLKHDIPKFPHQKPTKSDETFHLNTSQPQHYFEKKYNINYSSQQKRKQFLRSSNKAKAQDNKLILDKSN